MKISVHAGHNAPGRPGSGAVGKFGQIEMNESQMSRDVVAELVNFLDDNGIEVRDITVNDGVDQLGILQTLVKRANNYKADLNISIHFNAANTPAANGVECWLPENPDQELIRCAESITRNLATLGYKRRDTRFGKLYITRNMDAPTILIECGFLSSMRDNDIFYTYGPRELAREIASSIVEVYCKGKPNAYYRVVSQPLSYGHAEKLAERLNALKIYNEIKEDK